MHCKECRPLISAYHDGELDGWRRAQVAVHLKECQHCYAELAEMQRLSMLAQTMSLPKPHQGIWQRINYLLAKRNFMRD